MILHGRNADNSIHIGKFRLCKSAEKNCSEAGLYYSYLALYRISPPLYTPRHHFLMLSRFAETACAAGAAKAHPARKLLRKRRKTARSFRIPPQNGGIKPCVFGNARVMREIGKGLGEAKAQVRELAGVPLLFRVSEGRGRSSIVKGRIVATFPAVFTVRTESGEVRTFSYSAVHTREVLLLPDDKG